MIGKSMINAKNIICLCTALVLTAGFMWAQKNIKEESETIKPASTEMSAAEAPKPEPVAVTGRLAPSVPEHSCQFIRFDDDRAVFVNVENKYSFTEYGLYPDELVVTSDNGDKVTLSKDNGSVTMTCNGEAVDFFVFEGHVIKVEEGKLYYDDSPVERTMDTFSAYQLNDKYVIECVDRKSYQLRDKDGNVAHKTTIEDISGLKLEVSADERGYISLDDEGFYYPVVMLNGDIIETGPDMTLYVNGSELMPIGSNDRYVDPKAKLKVESAIEPEKPFDLGPVATANEGIKEISYEMLEYVNEAREQYGIQHLYGVQKLDEDAQTRADELTEDYSHNRGGDKTFSSVLDNMTNPWWHCGECIAQHETTSAHEVFEKLMDSEENRAILLDPKMKYLSAAFSEKDGVYYWDILLYNDTYMP